MRVSGLSLCVTLCLIGLGGCATAPNPQVDVSKLLPDSQRILQQAPLLAREIELNKACLVDKSPSERAATYDACYAAPLKALAVDTAYPNKPALDAYLAHLGAYVKKAGLTEPQDEFNRAKAKFLDSLFVETHRALANKLGFAGGLQATMKEEDAFKLKQDAIRLFVTTSDINRVLGATEFMVLAQSSIRRDDLARVRLDDKQQAALGAFFVQNVNAFFMYDDLNAINTFKLQNPDLVKKETSTYLGLLGTYEKFAKQRASRALAAYYKQESTSTEGQ